MRWKSPTLQLSEPVRPDQRVRAFCAARVSRVALIEREKFPREKRCAAIASTRRALPCCNGLGSPTKFTVWPHAIVNAVDFITIRGLHRSGEFSRCRRQNSND